MIGELHMNFRKKISYNCSANTYIKHSSTEYQIAKSLLCSVKYFSSELTYRASARLTTVIEICLIR